MRHAETLKLEEQLTHADELQAYAESMHGRVNELTQRYIALLKTGDTRIEHYYREVYVQAEQKKHQAEGLLEKARMERAAAQSVEDRIYHMADRFIQDHTKWVSQKLRADPENYQRNKTQLSKAFDFVEGVGYSLPKEIRREALSNLKSRYAEKTREQALKDEQKRIKAQMREEERARREREQAIREAEEQEMFLQQRLQEALQQQTDAHGEEIAELQRQLADAQASSERAKSMAQLTKTGHVYVLSNIGSFGKDIFKVGMTRRLDPSLRVKELGDASVPFPFDVHAMFSCDDAPTLENMLHRELTQYRVNRVNLRKEYFQVDLSEIVSAVEKYHGTIEYVAEPEALEYYESQDIRPEDLIEWEAELAEMGIDIDDDEDS
ncbi:MAG: GIY-YIG nuclease family protein [Planctomycetaceae bacterium]|nr:GIY-YIG nuclease family protein [Planctomycetaceae bacterium]